MVEVNDIKLFTAQPGSIVIRNCHRVAEECRAVGGQRAFQPGNVVRIPISGRVHIGLMHESYFMIRVRITHDGLDGASKFDPEVNIRKTFGDSTAGFFNRLRTLAGADREVENIAWYNMATNSLFDVASLPVTRDPQILYQTPDDTPFMEHTLYDERGGHWSRETWLKVPAQYCLTSKGPCFFPFLNLREDLTLEVTLATNEQLFQPIARGGPGVFDAIVENIGTARLEVWPDRMYSSEFVTAMHGWSYEIKDMYYLLSGINLDLGAEVNVADWHFDCIETSVIDLTTTGQEMEELACPLRRTSIQSIRAFFYDPRSMKQQNFATLPKYCYPEGAYYSGGNARVTWYAWYHGSQVWPTPRGTGDRFGDAYLWNTPMMTFAAQVYQKEISASMNLDSHALTSYEMLSTPTSFGVGQFSRVGKYTHGAVNWTGSGWRGSTPFWHDKEYAMFGTSHPEFIHGAPSHWAYRYGLGGKFMMFATFGPMTNDSGVVQGRNTFQDLIRVQWVRQNALPIGVTENYGALEIATITQTAPNLMMVAHSILSLSVSGGLILAAR